MSGSRNQLEQILELLLSENDQQAEEMLHEYVVTKAREEYEKVLDEGDDEDWGEEQDEEDFEDEIIGDEIGEDEDEDEEPIDQSDDFVDDVTDMGDEEGEEEMGGDEFGDDEFGGEEEDDVEDRVEDLEAELEDLRAEFERLMSDDMGGEDDMEMDMGGDDMEMDMGDEMPMDDMEGEEEMMDSVEYDLDEAEEVDEDEEELEEATKFSDNVSEQPMKGGNLKGSEADSTQSPYTKAPKPSQVGHAGKPVKNNDGGEGKKDHGGKVKHDSTHHNMKQKPKSAPSAKDGKSDVDGSNKTSPFTKQPK